MKSSPLRLQALLSAIAVATPVLMVTGSAALAGVNILVNPGLEALGANGFPDCWEQSGYGPNDYSFAVTSQAHSGANAMRVTITSTTGGDRKAMMLENPSCAPDVTPGHQYDLSLWYMADTPDVVVTTFRHDVQLGWQYWTDLETLPVSGSYRQASV